MRRCNQIKFFVRFKADRSLKCLQYTILMYITLFTNEHTRLHLICWFGFAVDNGGSHKTWCTEVFFNNFGSDHIHY